MSKQVSFGIKLSWLSLELIKEVTLEELTAIEQAYLAAKNIQPNTAEYQRAVLNRNATFTSPDFYMFTSGVTWGRSNPESGDAEEARVLEEGLDLAQPAARKLRKGKPTILTTDE